MLSRQHLRDFARNHFPREVMPILDQTDMMTGITDILRERDPPKSKLCRLAFFDTRLKHLWNFPQHIIVTSLKVSDGLISRCRQPVQEEGEAGID
jgi:hypothetical protein